ncbi:hypothetical protein [Streptomyces sp. NPDC056540]
MFITDTIRTGLPPDIAQVIAGHANVNTTMGYNAVYPTETIEAHRAFITWRRTLRPAEEYRTPTDTEWEDFLSHFERRKLSVGTCARAYGTACIHEHACVRCSLLRPDPAQRGRLVEIHDNLLDRIAEAEQEGWLGEIEGLRVSLAGPSPKSTRSTQHPRAGRCRWDAEAATGHDVITSPASVGADAYGPLQPDTSLTTDRPPITALTPRRWAGTGLCCDRPGLGRNSFDRATGQHGTVAGHHESWCRYPEEARQQWRSVLRPTRISTSSLTQSMPRSGASRKPR